MVVSWGEIIKTIIVHLVLDLAVSSKEYKKYTQDRCF